MAPTTKIMSKHSGGQYGSDHQENGHASSNWLASTGWTSDEETSLSLSAQQSKKVNVKKVKSVLLFCVDVDIRVEFEVGTFFKW